MIPAVENLAEPEHNILLQVRGCKEMTVGRFPDERTRQLELEDLALDHLAHSGDRARRPVSSINARLRRIGLEPKVPGERPGTDKVKAGASKALGRLWRR